ncbi:MAG: hypothetical protein PVH00_12385, partial [Gemmatimonadota bacterium]
GFAKPATAQDAGRFRVATGFHAIPLVTRADPALLGDAKTEAEVASPLLTLRVMDGAGRLSLAASINFEKWTLPHGDLAAGNAGEGYIDRRHPHTILHELVATARARWAGNDVSLSAGRGFAPFGTDDPMMRPFVKFPANHHLMQIPERLLLIAGVRRGRVGLEAGLFNGDEPTGPTSLGRLSRLGDSWSSRLTLRPTDAIELAASHARVKSPEHALGGGLDQRKWTASARYDGRLRDSRLYALLEWGETYEYASGVRTYVFTTVLGEAGLTRGGWRSALRIERTTRPEEERLADPFRSGRPHGDENIVGATRWNTVTWAAGRAFTLRGLALEPFAEAARSRVAEITGSIFDPLEFYGSTTLWNLSFGMRVRTGATHMRMGRYGAALPAASEPMTAMMHE